MARNGLKTFTALMSLAALVAIADTAEAVDAYQDRRGLFFGAGLGGGAAFQGGEPGGAILVDAQLGGGASADLTLALDVDLWFQLMDGYQNWFVTPGPELNYFVWEGLFVRAGVGMALLFTQVEDAKPDVPHGGKAATDTDFEIGFDGSVGLGWEFFTGASLALGVAVEGDYVVIRGDDVASCGFVLGLKYY